MPVGPPAMMLSALMEIKGAPEPEKMAVARVLTVSISIPSSIGCEMQNDIIQWGLYRTLISFLSSTFTLSRRLFAWRLWGR